jgi:hypothetical protein
VSGKRGRSILANGVGSYPWPLSTSKKSGTASGFLNPRANELVSRNSLKLAGGRQSDPVLVHVALSSGLIKSATGDSKGLSSGVQRFGCFTVRARRSLVGFRPGARSNRTGKSACSDDGIDFQNSCKSSRLVRPPNTARGSQFVFFFVPAKTMRLSNMP